MKLLRATLFILLAIIQLPGNAQKTAFTEDSLNYMSIMREGFAAVRQDSVAAMEVLERAVAFADSTDNEFFRLKNERLYIYYLEHWGLAGKADSLYDVMIAHSKTANDQQNLYSAYAGKAALFYSLGKHGQSLEYYFLAIDIAQKRNDSLNLSRIYNNLSLVQKKLQDYEGSAATLNRAIALKKALRDSQGIADNYVNLGNMYSTLEKKDSALWVYDEAARMYRELGDTVEAKLINGNIGQLYYHLGRYEAASTYLDSALKVQEQFPPDLNYLINLSFRGNAYNHDGEHQAAHEAFSQIETILDGQYYAPVLQEVYRGQAEALAALGDKAGAYNYMLKLREVEQDLSEAEEIELQEKYEALFQVKEKENELEVSALELENEKGKTRLWSIIGGAALLFFILAGVIALVIRKRNQALAEKNAVVTRSLKEREMLLREIHHRVKNNLQIISSMLSMQSRRTNDQEAKSGLQDSQNRVRSMSLIHEHLYSDEHMAGVNMVEYIDKLIANLRQSFYDPSIEIEKEVEALQLDIDTAVPFGLILNEAVTNSMKHAFEEGKGGKIIVKLKAEGEYVCLEVIDNGKGFAPEQRSKRSFGLTMMEAFTESLEGDFNIASEKGTQLSFRIKPQIGAA